MADPKEQLRKVIVAALHAVDCEQTCARRHTDDVWQYYNEYADAVMSLGEVTAGHRARLRMDDMEKLSGRTETVLYLGLVDIPAGSEGTEP